MPLYRLKIEESADLAQYGESWVEVEWVEAPTEAQAIADAVSDSARLIKIRKATDKELGIYHAGHIAGCKAHAKRVQKDEAAVEKRTADSWKAAVPMYLNRQRQQFLDALQKALAEIEEIKID